MSGQTFLGASRMLTTPPAPPLGSYFHTESQSRVDPPVGEEPEAQGREASGPQPTFSPVAEQGLVPVTQGSIQVPTQSLRDPKVLFIVGL